MELGKYYSIYIITNKRYTTLYIGVTNDLERRIWEHKNHISKKSFSARYNLGILLYYENFNNIKDAISREKQIKAGSRLKKILLIINKNPWLKDLAKDWY